MRLINILFGKVWGLWYLKWGLPPGIKFCSFFSSALGILTTVDLVTSLDLQNCMTIKYCGLQHGQQPMDRETNCLTVISSSEGESRQHQWRSIEQQQVLAKSRVSREALGAEKRRGPHSWFQMWLTPPSHPAPPSRHPRGKQRRRMAEVLLFHTRGYWWSRLRGSCLKYQA